MPCSDSLAQERAEQVNELQRLRDRNELLARVACTMGLAAEDLWRQISEEYSNNDGSHDFDRALGRSGQSPERVQEALDWWKSHKEQDGKGG